MSPRDPRVDPEDGLDLDVQLDPEMREAFRALDEALERLPRIGPHPQFEARFRARLARAEESARRGWHSLRWPRLLGWAIPTAGLAAVALALILISPSGPENGSALVADREGFELLMEADPELLFVLDELETWDEREPS